MPESDSTPSPRYKVEPSKGGSWRLIDTRDIHMRYGVAQPRLIAWFPTEQAAEHIAQVLNQLEQDKHKT